MSNISRWHGLNGEKCPEASEHGRELRKTANRHRNQEAVYISLDDGSVFYADAYKTAGAYFNTPSPHVFGQVRRGKRGSHAGQLVMPLAKFLTSSEEDITSKLQSARRSLAISKGGHKPRKNHERTTPTTPREGN